MLKLSNNVNVVKPICIADLKEGQVATVIGYGDGVPSVYANGVVFRPFGGSRVYSLDSKMFWSTRASKKNKKQLLAVVPLPTGTKLEFEVR